METVTIPRELAMTLAQIISQLPAGQVAKVLIALDECIRNPKDQPSLEGSTNRVDDRMTEA